MTTHGDWRRRPSARIQHALDTLPARVAPWLHRRTRGGLGRPWRRRRGERAVPSVRRVPGDAPVAPSAGRRGAPSSGIYRSDTARRSVLAAYDRIADTWPVERRDRDVETSAGSVHVIDSGPLDGRPVLLLHAASMGAISWAPNVAALSEAGYRTYAVDHPGEANRSVLADPASFPADDAAVAALYAEVADALGVTRSALLGASAGAQRAMRFALADPGRVTHLALLGPMGLVPLRPSAIVRMMLAALRPTPRRVRATARWALGDAPAVTDAYGGWFRLVLGAVAPPPRVARPTAIPPRLLRGVAVPTLVVLGDRDHLVGRPQRALRRALRLPDVRVHILGSGHLVNVERADDVNPLLVDLLGREGVAAASGDSR